MGIEPTHRRLRRCTGFEAREGHQAPGASAGGRWAPLQRTESPATVAPFRAWRGSPGSVAQDPAAIVWLILTDITDLQREDGGGGGIRTHGALVKRTHDFQSCPFGRSGTPPLKLYREIF